jgi:vacuolar iron transporter family protein
MTRRLEHEHTPEAIGSRLKRKQRPNYLRDWVYGGIDGAVTTFAVIAGVAGASLPSSVLLILGIANLVADGFSMAASNYSGTKAEVDDFARLQAVEQRHIRIDPEGEKEEIRQILRMKGLEGDTLEEAVSSISRNRAAWIDLMMSDEYGLSRTQRDPFLSGASTFLAFLICGAIPLIPYVAAAERPLWWAALSTSVVFFFIGAAKSYWSLIAWWRSGLETLFVGMVAASMAFLIGYGLREFLNIAV